MRIVQLAVPVLLAGAAAGGGPASADTSRTSCPTPPGSQTHTTSYPQDSHASFWTVPADVQNVCVEVVGAPGGDATASYNGNPLGGAGGSGGDVVAQLSVTPGQIFALGAGAAVGDLVSDDASSHQWGSSLRTPYSFRGGNATDGGQPGGYASVVGLWAPNEFSDQSQESYYSQGHFDKLVVVAGGGGGSGGPGVTSGPDGLPGPGATGGNGGTPDGQIGSGAGGGGATGSAAGTGGVGFGNGGIGSDGDLDETWDTWQNSSDQWLGRGGAGAAGVSYNGAACDQTRLGGWSGGGGGGGGAHGGGGGGRGSYDDSGCVTSQPGGGGGGGSSYVDPAFVQPGTSVSYGVADHTASPSITIVWMPASADTTPPAIADVPAAASLEATSSAGAVYVYTQPTATDAVDGAVPVSCAPVSGSTFPLGTTTVSCTAADSAGNTAEASFAVTVTAAAAPNVPPVAAFTASASGQTVSFDGSGSSDADGSIASYAWDFGDGTIGTGGTATHTYAAGGTYPVTLTVTDNGGATASIAHDVAVAAPPANQPPSASFTATASIAPGARDLAVDASVSHDSDGTIAGYSWDFGDGSTATGATASHTYAADGTYTITLTVTDDQGATGKAARAVSVPAVPVVNQPPTAAFAATPDGLAVAVDGSTSTDPDGSIVSYAWDFGDGTIGTGDTATHTYTSAGTHEITLAVTDDSGATASVSHDVTVVLPNEPPQASFVATPSEAPGSLSVALDASMSIDLDGSIVSYVWDFGDGTSGSGQTAAHTYLATGAYTATLTVTDDEGAKDTTSQTLSVPRFVSVNEPPQANFTVTPSAAGDSLDVSVDGSLSSDFDGSVASYTWDFGDGGTARESDATHTYARGGSYTITLTVADDDGATDTSTHRVIVPLASSPPVAKIVANRDETLRVQFDLSGSTTSDGGPIATWDFYSGYGGRHDQGSTHGTGFLPQYIVTYPAPGTYTATLTITDDRGATDTTTLQVTVPGPHPTASFTTSTSGLRLSADASASSDPDSSIVSYRWDFGDGSSGTGAFPVHDYALPGSYPVTLTVTDANGAKGSSSQLAVVLVAGTQPAGLIWSPSSAWLAHAVSCPSISLCVMVGESPPSEFSPNQNVVAVSTSPTDATSWTQTTLDDVAYGGGGLHGVSCPSTTLCVAVGAFQIKTSTNPSGGAWASIDTTIRARSISCPSSSLCVAAGADGTLGAPGVAVSTHPTQGAAAWHTFSLGAGAGGEITGVSCPSASLCVAVVDTHDGASDGDGEMFVSTHPNDGPGAWTKTTPFSDAPHFTGISCPSISLCVAADSNGTIWTSTSPAGGPVAWTRAPVSMPLTGVSCASVSFCMIATGDATGGALSSVNPLGGRSAWTRNPVVAMDAVSCVSGVIQGRGGTIVCAATMPPTTACTAGGVYAPGFCNFAGGSAVGVEPVLTVDTAGSEAGQITSSPAGVNCGQVCSHSYFTGSSVALTAESSTGSLFTGWSGGGCSGRGACTVQITGDTHVSANFAQVPSPVKSQGVAPPAGAAPKSIVVLQARFTVTPSNLPGSLSAAIDASSSLGPIASYAWDFGDGATGNGVSETHVYPHAGTYTVRLTVADGKGAKDTAAERIAVPASAVPAGDGAAGTLTVGTGADAPTVAWSAGTFATPVAVSVISTPSVLTGAAKGGGTALELSVTAADGTPVTRFSAPLELTFPPGARGVVPAYSINGTTWTAMPRLAGTTLPAGFKDGWYRDPDGTIHVLTMHATYFGLLDRKAEVRAELSATVRTSRRAHGSLVVRLRTTLPGRATVVLRRGNVLLARATHRVSAERTFVLHPRAHRAGRARLTIVVTGGGLRYAKALPVSLRR